MSPMPSAEDVVRRHIAAFERGDVADILDDYTPDALIQTPHEIVRGRDALHTWFTGVLELLPPGTTHIDSISAADEVVLVTWHAQTDAFALPLGVDTHIVRDAKIHATTVAFSLVPTP